MESMEVRLIQDKGPVYKSCTRVNSLKKSKVSSTMPLLKNPVNGSKKNISGVNGYNCISLYLFFYALELDPLK